MQTFTLCEGWRANSSSHWRGHRNSSRSLHYPMLLLPQNLFQFFKCIQNCHIETFDIFIIWGWVKTLVPSEPQNSWVKMDVNIPLKMVLIGVDPYPNGNQKIPNFLEIHTNCIMLLASISPLEWQCELHWTKHPVR